MTCQGCLTTEHETDKCPYIQKIVYYESGAPKLIELHDRDINTNVTGTPAMMDAFRGIGNLRPPAVPQLGVFNQDLPDAIMPQDMAARAKGGPL
jgi:hypothetical protein